MKKTSHPLLPWIVCLSCGLFFFFELIQMNMINSLAPALMADFNVTGDKLGLLSATYFDANLLFLFPAGMILDRFSNKKIVLLMMAVCTIGTFLFSQTHSLFWAAVSRFMVGMGGSFCFLSCMRLASIWFHESRLAFVTGLLMTMAFIGGTVAQTPFTLVMNEIGWRNTVALDAALGAVIFFIILFGVRDYPNEEMRKLHHNELKSIGFWKSLRLSYGNAQNWLGGICCNMMNLPVFILGAIYGGVFLIQTKGFTNTQASMATSMIFIGTLIGAPIVGFISDKIRKRKLPIIIGAVLSFVLITMIIYMGGLSLTDYIILFFLLGLISAAQIINYPLVAEKNSPALAGSSVSVVSFNVISGGAIFQPLVGWLLVKGWDGTKVNGVPQYTTEAYHHALLLLPLGFIIALGLLFFIKESPAMKKVHHGH